jgi:hypothetical protein
MGARVAPDGLSALAGVRPQPSARPGQSFSHFDRTPDMTPPPSPLGAVAAAPHHHHKPITLPPARNDPHEKRPHPPRQRWAPVDGDGSPPAAGAGAGLVDTHDLLSRLVYEFRAPIRAKKLDVSLRLLARQYRTLGDTERARQVLRGILRSAIDASRRGARITVRTTCPSDNALRVEVEELSGAIAGGTATA